MKEADLILGGFATRHVSTLNDGQLDRFEALLAESDTDLLNWILEREPVPAAVDHDVMDLLKDFKNRL